MFLGRERHYEYGKIDPLPVIVRFIVFFNQSDVLFYPFRGFYREVFPEYFHELTEMIKNKKYEFTYIMYKKSKDIHTHDHQHIPKMNIYIKIE